MVDKFLVNFPTTVSENDNVHNNYREIKGIIIVHYKI